MNAVFADSSYYIALYSQGDRFHGIARKLSRKLRCRLVLSEFILTELGAALSSGKDRDLFLLLVRSLRSDPNANVVPASHELFDRGLALFASRPDKSWSLVDCISFCVMKEHSLSHALTSDRHFEQAGFGILLK